MNNAEQIRAFCSALLGGPDGQGDDRLEAYRAYLWTIANTDRDAVKRTQWLRADDPSAVASAASSLAQQQPGGIAHIYVGTGLMSAAAIEDRARDERRSLSSMRATNDTTAGLLALAVDIDIRSDLHDTKPYPPDLASARRVYESVPLAPTMIVHTGNGLHAWWCFAEPWLVEDGDDPAAERAAMATLAQQWSATLRFHADRMGQWKIDSTFDLARVLRMPGTQNVKNGTAKPVALEHLDNAMRYEPSDFQAALADPEVIKAYASDLARLTVRELPGIDLHRVWSRVNSQAYRVAQYEPPWLTDMLELMPGSNLEAIWLGDRTASGDPSGSGVDAALTRSLINTKHVNTEQLVEAIMCRRLRSGDKVEKVDPHRRTDYLVTTISKIQASAEAALGPARQITQAAEAHLERAAAGRVETPAPERDAINHTVNGDDPAELDTTEAEFDAMMADAEPAEVTTPDEDRLLETTITDADQAKAVPDKPSESDETEDDGEFERVALAELTPQDETPAPRLTAVKPPPKDPPKSRAAGSAPDDDELIWPERHPDLVDAMRMLGELLIPEPYRKAGIEVWGLEYRDFGADQSGRLVLRIPVEYAWPGGNTPPTRRPGRPFYSSWYKREAFEVPKGFRWSLSRDALIPALQIGNNRDAWVALIDLLVPYWHPDSSGSDIVTQMHEWLLEYLVGHAAATEEAIAVDNRRSLLVDHANWGAGGAPKLLVCMPSFLDYVATRPGGRSGREAKTLTSYINLEQRRPRMTGSDGKTKRRASWYQLAAGEFTAEEWADVLDAARDALEAQERRLRAVPGSGR